MEQELQLNEHNKQEYPPILVNEYICRIQSCISNSIPSSLNSLKQYSQSEQKTIITAFQNQLLTTFTDSIRSIKWLKEYKMGTRRDAIDIYGKDCISGCNVIIELDKPRADQVAKKMLSRIANYFGYGKEIVGKINPNAKLIGCIIDNNLNVRFY